MYVIASDAIENYEITYEFNTIEFLASYRGNTPTRLYSNTGTPNLLLNYSVSLNVIVTLSFSFRSRLTY